jgi:hypothetical protein
MLAWVGTFQARGVTRLYCRCCFICRSYSKNIDFCNPFHVHSWSQACSLAPPSWENWVVKRCDRIRSGGNVQISWMSPRRGVFVVERREVYHFKHQKRKKWVYNSRLEKRNGSNSRLEKCKKHNSRWEICNQHNSRVETWNKNNSWWDM